jgi:hypothetical protein
MFLAMNQNVPSQSSETKPAFGVKPGDRGCGARTKGMDRLGFARRIRIEPNRHHAVTL